MDIKSEQQLSRIVTRQIATFYPELVLSLSLNGIQLPGTPKEKAQIIATMKREGMLPGIPDFSLYLPYGKTLHIELKHPNGKGVQSQAQKDIETKLITLKHNYYLCNTVPCVLEAIANNTSEEFREESYETLVNTIQHKDNKLQSKFLYFDVGEDINIVLETLRLKYYLTT